MNHKVVFEDKDALVFHIYSSLDNPTMLKVQKSLYFLWAYYAGTYGSIDKFKDPEIDNNYPKSLFSAKFEALMYGPLDHDVYLKQKEGFYSKNKWTSYQPKNSQETEVILFVNDLLEQINKVNDFGLINRVRDDISWKAAYDKGSGNLMNMDQVRQEYYYPNLKWK